MVCEKDTRIKREKIQKNSTDQEAAEWRTAAVVWWELGSGE
jgi:hypothetical protein